MSWRDNLLPASWRGLTFDVMGEQLQGRFALVKSGLPYADGDRIEDMGREGRVFSMRSVLFGDNYDSDLKAFLKALEAGGVGELIHPIYGSVQAYVETYQVDHDAERPDYCELALVFVQDTDGVDFFMRDLVVTDSDTVLIDDKGPTWQRGVFDLLARADSLVATVQQYLGGGWKGLMEQCLGLPGITSRLAQLRSQALGIVAGAAELVKHPGAIFDPLADLIRLPAEIRSALGNSVRSQRGPLVTGSDIPSSVPGGSALPVAVASLGDAVLSAARRGEAAKVVWPTMPADPVEAQAWGLLVLVVTEQALAVADATATVLNDEVVTPTLTPDDIDAVLVRSRALLTASIDMHRALYPVEHALAVIEPLRNLGSLLQGASRRLILARPPLIERTVAVPTTLRLLAFRWYGQHERADELLRLNPQLRTPYLIPAGEVLRGYAS